MVEVVTNQGLVDTQELQKEHHHRGIQMHSTKAQEAQAQVTSLQAKLGECIHYVSYSQLCRVYFYS